MPNIIQLLQRRFSKLAFRRCRASIVLEATVLLPFLLLLAILAISIQNYQYQHYNLQRALDTSLGELASKLNMFISLELETADTLEWALDGAELLGVDAINQQEKALLLEPYFRSAVLQVIFQNVFDKRCREMGIRASGHLQIEQNALIAFAQLSQDSAVRHVFSREEKALKAVKARVLCEGVDQFLYRDKVMPIEVYLTPHGIEESGKFHTHKCWSLIRAKNVIAISFADIPEGFPDCIFWQGKQYQICNFCYKEKYSVNSSK